MKKYRLFSFILAGSMLLTGCSGGGDDDVESTTTTQPYVEVTDAEGNTVTDEYGYAVTSIISLIPEEKELNVGFIYPGVAGADTVTQIFESARVQMERVLNANTCYIENVLVGQFEDATAQLVSNGCNVIIAASSRYANVAYEEARANKKIYFISVGGTKTSFNLACFQAELYKVAYICGMAAAYNSNSNILGVVADPSILSLFNIVDAYVLGAKELTEGDTDVRLNYAWGNREDENIQAIDDLIAQGCDVIFTATYSTEAVEYCEKRGVKVIGLAYNMPELAPNNYLTGAFYNVTTFIIDMLRSVRYNTSDSVTYLGGINEGAVRMIDINENAKEGTVEICDTLYQLCADGKAVIFNGEIRDNEGHVKVEKGTVLKSSEILTINWLEEYVTEVKDFCAPVVEPLQSDLVIHK